MCIISNACSFLTAKTNTLIAFHFLVPGTTISQLITFLGSQIIIMISSCHEHHIPSFRKEISNKQYIKFAVELHIKFKILLLAFKYSHSPQAPVWVISSQFTTLYEAYALLTDSFLTNQDVTPRPERGPFPMLPCSSGINFHILCTRVQVHVNHFKTALETFFKDHFGVYNVSVCDLWTAWLPRTAKVSCMEHFTITI